MLAEVGYYVAIAGQTSETACPAGETTLAAGATSCVAAPAITSASSATFTVGAAGTFTVKTSGIPTVTTLSDGSAALPTGVSFHDNGDGTATLAGTPAAGTGGTYSFTITADNGVTPKATQAFKLTVIYGFGGFMSPLAKSTLLKSVSTIPVKFVLTSASGTPISGTVATALANAGKVQVTLAGAGVAVQVTSCSWGGSYFQCDIKTPKGLLTGSSNPYTITVSENLGGGFVTAPAVAGAVNPETVYFK
jgi:hypothetical protein